MLSLYQILFFSGLLFSVCSFILSHVGGHGDSHDDAGGMDGHDMEAGNFESNLDGHADMHVDGFDHGGVDADFGHGGVDGGFDHGGVDSGFDHGGVDGGFDHGGVDSGFDHGGVDGGFDHGGVDGGFDHGGVDGGFDHGGADADFGHGADGTLDAADASGTHMETAAHGNHEVSAFAGIWGDWLNYLIPFRLSSLTLLSTVAGGLGMILTPTMHAIPTALISFGSGYAASSMIGILVLRPLKRMQNTSASHRRDVVGHIALVTSTILEGGFGRIRYSIRGQTYNAPAKHVTDQRVEQGENVVVRRIERGVYYVSRPMEHAVVLTYGKEPEEYNMERGGNVK